MLDPMTSIPVDPNLGVLVYADHIDPARVWALPAAPHLQRSSDGKPAISLLVYTRGANHAPSGGQLTLTVNLGLSDEKLAAIGAWVEHARGVATDSGSSPTPISVAVPTWLSGEVRLELVNGVGATGRPSLLADNACALVVAFDEQHSREVLDAWNEGLPEASVTYSVQVEAAEWTAAKVKASSDTVATTPSGQHRATAEYSVEGTGTRSVPYSFRLSGPITLTADDRATARTDFAL
jgi:hypothetical protein